MQEEGRDLLKRVTTATVRSFSGEAELMVNYSPGAATVSQKSVRLPLPSRGQIVQDGTPARDSGCGLSSFAFS